MSLHSSLAYTVSWFVETNEKRMKDSEAKSKRMFFVDNLIGQESIGILYIVYGYGRIFV